LIEFKNEERKKLAEMERKELEKKLDVVRKYNEEMMEKKRMDY
jgi:hypothetical protein